MNIPFTKQLHTASMNRVIKCSGEVEQRIMHHFTHFLVQDDHVGEDGAVQHELHVLAGGAVNGVLLD